MSSHWDLPRPSLEDFGLPPEHGTLSVTVLRRHRPGDEIRVTLGWLDEASSHQSDRTVVLELRDPGGAVVERAAAAVGRLTDWPMFELVVEVPQREPARYVARLEIHRPDAPPRVFEWPFEVPDPSAPLAAELEIAPTIAAPGDTLELTVRNTGRAVLSFGEHYELYRRREKGPGWSYAGHEIVDMLMLHSVEPARRGTLRVDVPRLAWPGRYRVVKDFGSEWARGTVRASVEFDVVARPTE